MKNPIESALTHQVNQEQDASRARLAAGKTNVFAAQEDESDEPENDGIEFEGVAHAPDQFFGLHPNHRPHGRAVLAYRQENSALASLA